MKNEVMTALSTYGACILAILLFTRMLCPSTASAADLGGGIRILGDFTITGDYRFGHDPNPQGSASDAVRRLKERLLRDADPGEAEGTGDGKPDGKDESGKPGAPLRLESGFGVSQELSLALFAPVNQQAEFALRLKTSGVWGVQFPSDGSYGMTPTFAPPIIDEAYARYFGDFGSITLGRLRFSLGPVGLLVDNALFPLEGILVDVHHEAGSLTGVYSRLSSQYRYGTYEIEASDDLIAARVTGKAGDFLMGYNYLYSGLVDETGHSIDIAGRVFGHAVRGEFAYFRPSTTFDPKFNFGWVPGAVVSLEVVEGPQDRLYIDYGWLAKGFTPTFSASASSSGGMRLGFYENTRGFDIRYSHLFAGGEVLDVGFANLSFIDPASARERGLTAGIPLRSLRVGLTKPFASNLRGNVGLDYYAAAEGSSGAIKAGFTFSF